MKEQQHKNLIYVLIALSRRAADQGNLKLMAETDELVADATIAYLRTYAKR